MKSKDIAHLDPTDFGQCEFWTWDEAADDGTVVALNEIPLCANGERDVDALFCRCESRFADGSIWPSVVGIRGDDLSPYIASVYNKSQAVSIHEVLDNDVDANTFSRFFARTPEDVFPVEFMRGFETLDHSMRFTIEPKLPNKALVIKRLPL